MTDSGTVIHDNEAFQRFKMRGRIEQITFGLCLFTFGVPFIMPTALWTLWVVGVRTIDDKVRPQWPESLLLVPFFVAFAVLGGTLCAKGATRLNSLIDIDVTNDHSMRLYKVCGQTDISLHDLRTIRIFINCSGSMVYQIIHARGKDNLPEFVGRERLISLILASNPSVRVISDWKL